MWRELGRTTVMRRVCLICGLTAIAALALCASALAAGKTVTAGSPLTNNPP